MRHWLRYVCDGSLSVQWIPAELHAGMTGAGLASLRVRWFAERAMDSGLTACRNDRTRLVADAVARSVKLQVSFCIDDLLHAGMTSAGLVGVWAVGLVECEMDSG